jgi:hypothetical protein
MSAVTETELPRPFVLPDSGVLSQPWQGHTARFEIRLKSSVAVISAHGDIDASNAGTLAEYTLGHVMGCRGLILDLRHRLGACTWCSRLTGAADLRPTRHAARGQHPRRGPGRTTSHSLTRIIIPTHNNYDGARVGPASYLSEPTGTSVFWAAGRTQLRSPRIRGLATLRGSPRCPGCERAL